MSARRRLRRTDGGFKAAGEVIPSVLEGLGLTAGEAAARARLAVLWQQWAAVMGPDIALLCRPLGHRKGQLIVGCADAMLAQDLHFAADALLGRANGFLACPFFHGLRVELLRGRTGLDARNAPPTPPRAKALPGETQAMPREATGRLLAGMDPASPVARAYARFAGKAAQQPQKPLEAQSNAL